MAFVKEFKENKAWKGFLSKSQKKIKNIINKCFIMLVIILLIMI